MGLRSPRINGTASGNVILTDLEVDGTTIVVDETNDRVGIGTASPGVQLEVQDTTTSSANTGGALRLSANDGAVMGDSHRLGVIEFTGAEDASNTQTVGARIEALTDASWTNVENGAALYFYTTDGDASQTNVLKLDSNKKATFAGAVQLSSTTTALTLQNTTSENSDGGCESKIIFEDHGDNALGQIEVSHSGSSDDEKGKLILSTNNDSGLQAALTIDDTQAAVFAGSVITAKDIQIESAPADTVYSGVTANFVAGEDLEDGECVYLKSDGKMWKAVATAVATARCVAMCCVDTAADASGPFLLQGFLRADTNFPTWTVGGALYTPEAETSAKNVPEQAAPADSGDFVQVIGFAMDANTVYFDPGSTIVEIA